MKEKRHLIFDNESVPIRSPFLPGEEEPIMVKIAELNRKVAEAETTFILRNLHDESLNILLNHIYEEIKRRSKNETQTHKW